MNMYCRSDGWVYEEPSPAKLRKEDVFMENIYDCQLIIDKSETILRIFENLYKEKQMCDVYLKVGNEEHAAHRLILCASSDVFQAMLMKPEWTEWHESKVVLQETPECEKEFHHFLEYLYTGKIYITHINVLPVLMLADKYIVKSLTKLCLEYMDVHLTHATYHNQLYTWLQYLLASGHNKIVRRCQNFIKWNFEAVAKTSDFGNFEVDAVVDLLKQNNLVIYNEVVLYNCVVQWLDTQKTRLQQMGSSAKELSEEMKTLCKSVMSHVRFPMMTPRELADLLLSPPVKEHKEFFMDRMAIGMTYHLGQMERLEKYMGKEEDRRLFVPRLYTSDSFSVSLMVDNARTIMSYRSCTYVFSSHLSSAEFESDKMIEWVADFYPKGVWFQKCYLIIWQGTLEVPEEIISTVRLSLTCRDLLCVDKELRVHVAVLIYGKIGGIEHVMKIVEKVHHFNATNQVLNFEDLIPYKELNPPLPIFQCDDSIYLVGPERTQVRLSIVITPTTALCHKNVSSD